MDDAAKKKKTTAKGKIDEETCEMYRAAYETCFDQWYSNIFLKGKSGGVVGCTEEYTLYAHCIRQDLDKDGQLMEKITDVMDPSHRQRFESKPKDD